MAQSSHVLHEIHPVFNTDSRILILGSFPSVKSRESQFFYGHPRNRFWDLLATLTGEPLPAGIEEKKSLLFAHHIAVWDVIASCDIEGSSDSSIHNVVPNDLSEILQTASIRQIFTNGGTAYRLYKKYCFPQTQQKASVCHPQVRQMQPGQRNACLPNGIRSVLISNKNQQTGFHRPVQK